MAAANPKIIVIRCVHILNMNECTFGTKQAKYEIPRAYLSISGSTLQWASKNTVYERTESGKTGTNDILACR